MCIIGCKHVTTDIVLIIPVINLQAQTVVLAGSWTPMLIIVDTDPQ